MSAFATDEQFYDWQISEFKMEGKSKEDLLEEAKTWFHPTVAVEYINQNWEKVS